MKVGQISKDRAALLGWFLLSLFFCYQYLLRVTPGVISNELRHVFLMTAEDFSTLGAYYLYAYSILQIPLGFLIDYWGVKRTVLWSIALCVFGTFCITMSHQIWVAQVSRILVGAGSASAFMASLKWVADHFEPGRRGFLIGASLTFGTIGALCAGKPFVMMLDALSSWEQAVRITGLMGIGMWLLILLNLRDLKQGARPIWNNRQMIDDLKAISCNRSILIYAFLAIGLYTPLAVLADLWGVSFLIEKFSMTRSDAASTTMMMYAGLAIGSLVLPHVAEKRNALIFFVRLCSLVLLILFGSVLYVSGISVLMINALFLSIGFFCGAEMICFTGAVLHTTPDRSGLTIGFVNTLNMMGGAFLQQIIGKGLDLQWRGLVDASGIRLYTADQYMVALSILMVVLFACSLVALKLQSANQIAS